MKAFKERLFCCDFILSSEHHQHQTFSELKMYIFHLHCDFYCYYLTDKLELTLVYGLEIASFPDFLLFSKLCT